MTSCSLRAGDDHINRWTDCYFKHSKAIVERFGDQRVTYAIFIRRPVISAPRLALEWLSEVSKQRGCEFQVQLLYPEGSWVGAGEPILYLSGSFYHLVDLETLLLMKIGPACVAAYQTWKMCSALPRVRFLAMDARHCAGTEMAEMMAYAASVGSRKACLEGAVGFVGNATDATAHYFDQLHGYGTMPHALIGYAGSTVRAAQLFHQRHPEKPLTVLVDYFGREVSDSLEACRAFPQMAEQGKLCVRLDTPGGRFVEGLDPANSYAILESRIPQVLRGYCSKTDLQYLLGAGVSAAAIHHLRHALDQHGFKQVKITASGGFNVDRCRLMAQARAPVDTIGTGSFLPEDWSDTYATADVIAYNGQQRVKCGREFLFPKPGDLDGTIKEDED